MSDVKNLFFHRICNSGFSAAGKPCVPQDYAFVFVSFFTIFSQYQAVMPFYIFAFWSAHFLFPSAFDTCLSSDTTNSSSALFIAIDNNLTTVFTRNCFRFKCSAPFLRNIHNYVLYLQLRTHVIFMCFLSQAICFDAVN